MKNFELYVGVTGRMGSGKGEIIRVLLVDGFKAISLSDIVREEAAKTGKEVSRSVLQDIGNGLRAKGGSGVLGSMVGDKVFKSKINLWAIDGIRNPAEVTELKKLPNFVLIGIDCDVDQLISRIIKRARNTDIAAEADLRARLDREWGIGEPEGGQQVGKCMEMADYTINNNKTLEYLDNKTRETIKEITKK